MRNNAISYIILSLSLVFVMSGCSTNGSSPAPQSKAKVYLIGIDGADWQVIDLMMEHGELPAFMKLKAQGSWGYLNTIRPTESISIWTSIATGLSPTKHQVQTFIRRIPGTDEYVATPGTNRAVPALWNIVSNARKSVVSVKWFATWPAEQVNGAMISPRLEPDSGGFETYPLELFKEIKEFRYKSTLDRMPVPKKRETVPNTASAAPGSLIGLNLVETKMFDDTSVWYTGRYALKKYNPDLFMIYFKSIDGIQHYVWGAQEYGYNQKADDFQQSEAAAIFAWYRYFDQVVADLMQDPDVTLVVVSDHGFQASDSTDPARQVFDLSFDLLLAKLGYYQPKGRKTDWNQTQAYEFRSWPYDLKTAVNINLAGREPFGSVSTESRDILIERIRTDIEAIHTMDGRSIFKSIPAPEGVDILFSIAQGLKGSDTLIIDSRPVAVDNLRPPKNLPRGVHVDAPPGIICVMGPEIKQGHRMTSAHVFDITPTVLYLMNLPVARDFDGQILLEIIKESHLTANPVQTIDTYGQRPTIDSFDKTSQDDKIIKELKALGYI